MQHCHAVHLHLRISHAEEHAPRYNSKGDVAKPQSRGEIDQVMAEGKVSDPVPPVACAELEHIRAQTADQQVVACLARHEVGPCAANKSAQPEATIQRVTADASLHPVRDGIAGDGVAQRRARHGFCIRQDQMFPHESAKAWQERLAGA